MWHCGGTTGRPQHRYSGSNLNSVEQVNGCDSAQAVPVVSFESTDIGVRCTAALQCVKNTSLCTYSRGGHFNKGDTPSPSFPAVMTHQILHFFMVNGCELGVEKACQMTKHTPVTGIPTKSPVVTNAKTSLANRRCSTVLPCSMGAFSAVTVLWTLLRCRERFH